VLLEYRPGGYVGVMASGIFLVQRAIGIIPIKVQGVMSSLHVINTLFKFLMGSKQASKRGTCPTNLNRESKPKAYRLTTGGITAQLVAITRQHKRLPCN
jgi:hypothetical protein